MRSVADWGHSSPAHHPERTGAARSTSSSRTTPPDACGPAPSVRCRATVKPAMFHGKRSRGKRPRQRVTTNAMFHGKRPHRNRRRQPTTTVAMFHGKRPHRNRRRRPTTTVAMFHGERRTPGPGRTTRTDNVTSTPSRHPLPRRKTPSSTRAPMPASNPTNVSRETTQFKTRASMVATRRNRSSTTAPSTRPPTPPLLRPASPSRRRLRPARHRPVQAPIRLRSNPPLTGVHMRRPEMASCLTVPTPMVGSARR